MLLAHSQVEMKNLFLGCLFVFIFAISTCAFSFADFTQEEHQSALNFTNSTLQEQKSGLNFTDSTQEEQQSAFSSTDSIEEEQSAFNITQYRLGVHPSRNTTRHKRRLWYWRSAGCTLTGNPIDDCWRCDPHWHSRRKRLADCVTGFGKNTIGGRDGAFYTVYDSSDDPVNPRPGTLRYGVIQKEPLWIVFARDMTIVLKQELIVNSHKTIDGRGHIIRIAYGGCITIQYVRNVIIHGIGIHSCRRTGPAMVRSSTDHVGWRTVSDGDGISIFGSRDIWIDHCFLANCADGLIDAIMGSTGITISNNYFRDHNKVMLLGHSDAYTQDKTMQVTIAYNHFGEGLVQRMPRCRYGYFHIVNNHYSHWKMYAIGGSANPTINSQGNRFVAPADLNSKQVTKREFSNEGNWLRWNWRTQGDSFINGAYFRPSGAGSGAIYNKVDSLAAKPASSVPALTAFAGPLECSRRRGIRC